MRGTGVERQLTVSAEGSGRDLAPHCGLGSDLLHVTLSPPPCTRQKGQHLPGEGSH